MDAKVLKARRDRCPVVARPMPRFLVVLVIGRRRLGEQVAGGRGFEAATRMLMICRRFTLDLRTFTIDLRT